MSADGADRLSVDPVDGAEQPRWRRKARALPADDSGCGWLAALPPLSPPRRLDGMERVAAVVVGAGFTGLAAARRLAELLPGRRVALVEAQRAGFGAAGRSSGFVVDLAHFVARMAPEAAEGYIRLARFGIAELRQRVEAAGIDCQWDEKGWMHVAGSEEGEREVESLRAWLEGRGEGYQWLDAAALQAITGSAYYRAGIRLPGSVLVHPALLVHGLVGSLPPTVELYEESPVRRIEATGSGLRLTAGAGTLEAERVLLTTNGCTKALGFLRRRVLPLLTFGSFTRRLTAAEQAALGGEAEWGLLAEDAGGSTLRRTRDGRILVRNSVHYDPGLTAPPAVRRRAREIHRRSLAARFPALAEVELEQSWAGVMGVTPSRGPFFGRLAPGLFAAAGYTGAGIAMGTAFGRLLADLAAGEGSDLLADARALPQPSRLPPEPFLSLGARWHAGRMNAAAGPAP